MSRGRARVLALTGAALTGLIAGEYAMSLGGQFRWTHRCSDGWLVWISVEGGFIRLVREPGPPGRYTSGLTLRWQTGRPVRWTPSIESGHNLFVVLVPLWIPLLAFGIPTIFLLRAALEPRPGSCRSCGYDLTGVPVGHTTPCPECGKPLSAPGTVQIRTPR